MAATPDTSGMTRALGGHADSAGSGAPDWEKVPFDVACARCGHDLRGLSEPVCPACGLGFDWSDAVPIEQLTCGTCGYHLYGLTESRCPECGTAFTWEEALERYYRQRAPLFEYQWRSGPIRSFFRTWLRTLCPRRFWRSIDIHNPPRVWPLLATLLGMLAFVPLAIIVVMGLVVSPLWWTWAWWTGQYPAMPSFGGVLVRSTVSFATHMQTYRVVLIVAMWFLVSFLSLLLLRQSMRRYGVRAAHVVRVCIYAIPAYVPLACVLGYPQYYLRLGLTSIGILVFPAVAVVGAIWSIRCAYRYYLKVPHSLGVAVATQTIAIGVLMVIHLVSTAGTAFFLSTFRDVAFG